MPRLWILTGVVMSAYYRRHGNNPPGWRVSVLLGLEFGGCDVAEIECGLGRLGNPAGGASHAARGGFKGPHNQGGPGHKVASLAVCSCSLSRKAALRSDAAIAAMTTARLSCGRVPQAFLAISEPERNDRQIRG